MNNKEEAYRIFNNVFNIGMPQDVFEHKHFDNPNSIKEPIRIYREDGKAAGINAFMGIYLLESGNRHFLTQSNDTAVISEFRGKHIFTKIITQQEKEDKESEFIFGIPNANSYPGFLKMGWIQKGEFTHFVKMLRPMHLLLGDHCVSRYIDKIYGFFAGYRKYLLKENETIERQKNVHFTGEELDLINKGFSSGFERSNEYFHWKLGKKREKMNCIILREGIHLKGYILYHTRKRGKGIAAVIDDFFTDEGNDETLKKLLADLSKNVDMLDNPLVNPRSEDAKLLSKAGLMDFSKLKKTYKKQVLLVSPRGKNADYMEKCQMRFIDTDIFLNN